MDIRQISKREFDMEVTDSKLPVLVDFWAPWCGPCRMLTPVLHELAGEMKDQLKVLKVNVDEEPELASQFGVMSIPTVIAFKKGKATSKVVGFRGKDDLKKLIF